MTERKADLTFQHNLKRGRHGWLRLTPAYSVKLVYQIIDQQDAIGNVLDPFSGTGTTGLVCAERGINATLVDINPFLVWFARVKTANYTIYDLHQVRELAENIAQKAILPASQSWLPPIHDITRWWTKDKLDILTGLHREIQSIPESPVKDLLLVALCRVVIDWSNAAFNHQSMSFEAPSQPTLFDQHDQLVEQFVEIAAEIAASAKNPVVGQVEVLQADARQIPGAGYDCVITSPPYPNRMSYIRELRPYMYWLGYLTEAREAGELDWQAIGGTWGIATSRLNDWKPNGRDVPHDDFALIISRIAEKSALLSNYVHRYFVDMTAHVESLYTALRPGAPIYYVVGNSKFYDTLVPVEQIYASLFKHAGFSNVKIENIRKRNSKKELFEFIVSGRKIMQR